MRRVAAGGWVLSLDMRGMLPLALRRTSSTATVTTVGLDEPELRRLFGDAALLRRVALVFELTELVGRHPVFGTVLAALPPLRSHLLGLWRIPDGTKVSQPSPAADAPAQ